MADEIRPALTPEKWTKAYERETDASLGFHPVHTELVEAADHGRYDQAVALANAARDDADPGKFTRADVYDILDAATAVALAAEEDGLSDESRTGYRRRAERVRRAAAKLAAILPPPVRTDTVASGAPPNAP